jgi:hypothetical protein
VAKLGKIHILESHGGTTYVNVCASLGIFSKSIYIWLWNFANLFILRCSPSL